MSANGRFIGRALQAGGVLVLAGFLARAAYSAAHMDAAASLGTQATVFVFALLPGLVVGGMLIWAGAGVVKRNTPPPDA
ncbi:hypothetical protein [Caenispirillum bisanense]|uniref:Uncharacterized protein n=1 Tax=Caenispirillum bisanense TaxID=414052 RepID=A0A286GSD3_9PROT|nr:hypothetical protein [Caenispirillum bisanense]SOD97864.1 hypothetical protein SAMN05421508_107109 [Caenispirillum bisanense]